MGVAIYCRISEDQTGAGHGVARQEQDCRKLARQRKWPVAYVAIDNDVSAYKRKPRPEFERVLADLKAGVLDGLIVYDCDRLARRPVDLERLIDLYDERPLKFATVTQEIDLSKSDGRFIARLMVNFANKSSADTSRRVTRAHRQLAERGVPVGGHRPFGYKADKRTLEPKEAKLIRQAASDILAGMSTYAVCRQWNEAGIKTSAGNHWQHQVLKAMLLSPRMAGYRVYRGEIARDSKGNPVKACTPVLKQEMWEAVCATLSDPARKQKNVGKRKYLLSGIVRCSSCGQGMNGNNQPYGFVYVCHNEVCPKKMIVTGRHVDEMITKLVKAYLAERHLKPLRKWDGEAALVDVTNRIAELMNAYGSRELSSEVVFPQVAKLEAEATRLRADKEVWLRETVRPVTVSGAWPEDVQRQRAIIESLIVAVVIRPAVKMGNKFQPERVEPPVWKVGAQPSPKLRQSKAGRRRAAS